MSGILLRKGSDKGNMMNMHIENVTKEDAAELLNIYSVYVRDTAISFEYDVPTTEEFEYRIETISARYPYIKAVDDKGKILGYAYATTFKNRRAYDWSVETTIYVSKDCRKKGIGRMLYTALEQSLKQMGILNMNACIAYTDKLDKHLTNDSKAFHESMGFQLVGRFHKCGYKFNTWYDMIWMEKLIGEHTDNPVNANKTKA